MRCTSIRRLSRVIAFLVILSALAMPSTTLAASGDLANPTDEAIKLTRKVVESDDPVAAYLDLSEQEQRADDSVLGRPGQSTSTQTIIPLEPRKAVVPMASGCWSRVNTKESYSLGFFQWRISQTLFWCGDGMIITYNNTDQEDYTVQTGTLWNFAGIVSKSVIGANGWGTIRIDRQDHFQYCPPIIGCVQNAFPVVAQQGSGDGSYWQN